MARSSGRNSVAIPPHSTDSQNQTLFITKAEAAKMLSISVRTLSRWLKEDQISFFKKGSVVRISIKEIFRIIDDFTSNQRDPHPKIHAVTSGHDRSSI
jgi:excisionase family DNA binding protein